MVNKKFKLLSLLNKIYNFNRKIQIFDSGLYIYYNFYCCKKNIKVYGWLYSINLGKVLGNVLNYVHFLHPYSCLHLVHKKEYNNFFSSRGSVSFVFFNYGNLSYFSLLNILCLGGFFRTALFSLNYYLNLGTNDSVEITGYFRRIWFVSKQPSLCLKVGHSYIDRIIIPQIVKLNLFKNRFLSFYSFDLRFLKKFIKNLIFLQKADKYKASGIRLKSEYIYIKEKLTKK